MFNKNLKRLCTHITKLICGFNVIFPKQIYILHAIARPRTTSSTFFFLQLDIYCFHPKRTSSLASKNTCILLPNLCPFYSIYFSFFFIAFLVNIFSIFLIHKTFIFDIEKILKSKQPTYPLFLSFFRPTHPYTYKFSAQFV